MAATSLQVWGSGVRRGWWASIVLQTLWGPHSELSPKLLNEAGSRPQMVLALRQGAAGSRQAVNSDLRVQVGGSASLEEGKREPGRTSWRVNKTQPGEGEVDRALGRGHHLSKDPETRPGTVCLRNSLSHSRHMGHGKGGFCLKGNGELQKVVDGERKGPECLTSRRCEEQAQNQEAGGGGRYHKICEMMMLVGSGQQGQRSRSSLCGWEGDCRPQKHLALGVKKAMRSPRDGGRGSPPLARRLGALILYFLNGRQEACVFLLHGPRRIARL